MCQQCRAPSIKFKVQRSGDAIEKFLRGAIAMSFSRSSVDLQGDVVALLLSETGHAGLLR